MDVTHHMALNPMILTQRKSSFVNRKMHVKFFMFCGSKEEFIPFGDGWLLLDEVWAANIL